jgi:alkanesulfonate monooxygenase SsuD/methylene tetrahydromethanopterin reductase-like flavin-dependent oxidoreductase (luciferase family)
MRLGLQIPDFTWPNGVSALGADLAATVRTADEAGFDSIAVMDHFFQIRAVGPAENDMLEAYTTLGFIAAHTQRAKLLTVVTGVLYRHPGLLAKAITTLDVLSGGRAILGIGAGWTKRSRRGSAFRSRPSRSGSNCWRRPSSTCCRCGPRATRRSRASISTPPGC